MDGIQSSINGVVIQNMILRRAAKECIRFRYFVTNSVVRLCDIRYCGVEDFQLGSKGENGEGVCEYVFVSLCCCDWVLLLPLENCADVSVTYD